MPDAVKLYDHEGNPIDSNNPLPISSGGGGGGGATEAKQDTQITHLTDIETAVETVAGAVAGSEMQVDVATIAQPSAVYSGHKTISSAGTQEAISASQAITSGVTVKALADNTGDVYVGNSGVDSTNGLVLAAGEQVFIEIDNLSKVYIDVETNDEGVSWIAS